MTKRHDIKQPIELKKKREFSVLLYLFIGPQQDKKKTTYDDEYSFGRCRQQLYN